MTHNPTTRYRKLPVEIEARQLTAESYRELIESLTVEEFAAGGEAADGTVFLEIRTLEGVMRASEGDWIIRGVKGELYPIKDSIFRATYEPVLTGTERASLSEGRALARCDREEALAAVPSAVDRAELRDLIAEAMREHGMVHLGDQVPDDEYDCCADAVLAKLPPPVDRSAVLREASVAVAALDRRKTVIQADTIRDAWEEGRDEGADLLRRMADEAEHEEPVRCPLCADARALDTPAEAREHFTTVHPEERLVGSGPWPLLANRADEEQQPETQAHPPYHRWYVETLDDVADEWAPGMRFTDRAEAMARYETVSRKHPTRKDGAPVQRRFVRETTSYTVEAEHTPAVVESGKEA